MPSSRPWLTYTLLRVGMFAVVFGVLALIGVNPILAAVIAAVVGLCVSYIFLNRQRDRVAVDLHQRRTASKRDRDGDAEDDVLDRAHDASSRHPSPSRGEPSKGDQPGDQPGGEPSGVEPSEGERDR